MIVHEPPGGIPALLIQLSVSEKSAAFVPEMVMPVTCNVAVVLVLLAVNAREVEVPTVCVPNVRPRADSFTIVPAPATLAF